MATDKKCLGILASLLLTATSCGSSEVVTDIPADHARLKALVTVYAYACRDLKRPPENFADLSQIFKQAKIENPREYFASTRDGKPYVILWGLDLEGRYLGTKVPIAYERGGKDGKRLLVTCNMEIKELAAAEFAQSEWPTGYEPELAE
ncbi:MAG: hypothetical protein ACR2NM_02315 [Bythopirellula sp.]